MLLSSRTLRARRFTPVHLAPLGSYIPTKEGWLYLSVVLDLHSRALLGYQTGGAMPATIVTGALQQALNDWKLPYGQSLFHSDRGSQYTSKALREQLRTHGLSQSMSAKGTCYDNAACESFFSTLKRELLPACGFFGSRTEANAAIFEHLHGFYNTRRKHSALGYLSPLEFLKKNNNTLALPA